MNNEIAKATLNEYAKRAEACDADKLIALTREFFEKECGSLGAAILAACAVGERENAESAQECNPAVLTITPDETKKAAYDEAYERYNRLFDAVSGLY